MISVKLLRTTSTGSIEEHGSALYSLAHGGAPGYRFNGNPCPTIPIPFWEKVAPGLVAGPMQHLGFELHVSCFGVAFLCPSLVEQESYGGPNAKRPLTISFSMNRVCFPSQIPNSIPFLTVVNMCLLARGVDISFEDN